MSILAQETIRGNKWNWGRAARVEVYDSGYVRVQMAGEPGDPADVVLLTPAQIKRIARLSEESMSTRSET